MLKGSFLTELEAGAGSRKVIIGRVEYKLLMHQAIGRGNFIAWSNLKSHHTNIVESIVNKHCQGDAALKDQMIQALNLVYKTYEQRNHELEKQTAVVVDSFTKPLDEAIDLHRSIMKKHQTMDSCSRLPFKELHKQAKQTANEDLASNLPKAPIGLVNSTKEKFDKLLQKICEEYRAAYKNPEVKKGGFFSRFKMRKKNEGVLQGGKCVSNKLDKQLLKDFDDKINVLLEKKFNDFRNRNAKYEAELLEDGMGKILESVTMYKNMVGEAMENLCISETDFEHVHQQSKAAALECLEKSSIRDKEKFFYTLKTAIKQEHEKALERLATLNTVAEQQATKPMHSFKFGEIIVQVANCGITDLPKSNIIVNSVGSDFNLARGQVSRILLHHVGPQLQTECKNNPKFATESYRITSGGNLCDNIVHYVLPSEEYRIEESIMELLEKCDTLGATTVVMPVLGSGERGIPVARCAQFLWAAICLLNSYRKPAHLNCIKIPAFDVRVFNGLMEFFNKPPKFLGFPTHWGNVSKGTTEMKSLASDSKEYNAVVAAFKKSNPPVKNIVLIERIQNPSLYKQYEGKREAMVDKVQNSVIERELFHGTTEESSNKIINNYFNRSYAGKNAALYGEGVYFALNSSYSHKYCSGDVRHMLVVKVLTGDYCLGTKQMKEPPKIDGTSHAYHSLVNNVNNPEIFVVFNDASAYPKYRITYT